MGEITKRLRQYEGDISQTTMCYNGTREEAAAEIDALREARVRAETYIKAMRVRTESLESLLRRWIALDAGCWHPNRHEDNTTELIGDTRTALGWGNKS